MDYNFDKYGKAITSTMGTPYDYWSVMHSSKTAFSNNNGSSIATKDPRFEDVIGQHLEMSFYDALELNRRYDCSKLQQCQQKVPPCFDLWRYYLLTIFARLYPIFSGTWRFVLDAGHIMPLIVPCF